MSTTTTDTIETMLEDILTQTAGSEVHFKIRTSLQLLDVIEEQHEAARQALEDCEMDEELRENLQDLGYLD